MPEQEQAVCEMARIRPPPRQDRPSPRAAAGEESGDASGARRPGKHDGSRVKLLRQKLALTRRAFARIVGADLRSVCRWEAGHAQPSGTSEAVIAAFEIACDSPERRAYVAEAQRFGLTYLLIKLIGTAVPPPSKR